MERWFTQARKRLQGLVTLSMSKLDRRVITCVRSEIADMMELTLPEPVIVV